MPRIVEKALDALAALAVIAGGLFVLSLMFPGAPKASEKCTPVDPASMVWTGHGFSIAMNDGHLWINRKDVVYAEVAQPHVCMPAKGMMQLLLPHAWPAYALTLKSSPYVQLAHGDAEWINKGRYRSQAGELCCGKDDCQKVEPGDVKEDARFYTFTMPDMTFSISKELVLPSEDDHYWVCRVGQRVRCVFAPHSGS